MELKINPLTAITLLLASLACIPSASKVDAQNLPFVDQGRVKYAGAFYSNIDGCIAREISILAEEDRFINPPFIGSHYALIDVLIFYTDICLGEELIAASDNRAIARSDFQVRNDLTSATLNTKVTIFNFATGEDIVLDVNMEWTGTSPREVSNFNHMFVHPDCRQIERDEDAFRSASVSGSVTYNGTNLLGGPVQDAEIGVIRTGTVVIGCT